MNVSVLISTHNPHPGRLARVLEALRVQTLPPAQWEVLLIDNASLPPVDPPAGSPGNLRILREPQLGLNAARRRGLAEARAPLCVLVDDDNVLAPDYLAQVVRLFAAHPRIGALGGKSLPEFERQPLEWQREFLPLLALRDHGDQPVFSTGLRPAGRRRNEFPSEAAPIGAGMALRLNAAQTWVDAASASRFSDRRGTTLTSGGDNDIVLTIMKHGWEVAYFPELVLTHLIPATRLEPGYLARLNRGIQCSWMQVLADHEANPWPAIAPWTVPLRQLKAWFTHCAWKGAAAHIRWQGACGHFEGRRSSPSKRP